MTDRELLEMAAKAAGYGFGDFNPFYGLVVGGAWWNPLVDDGHALKLAVKLGFDYCHDLRNRRVYCESEEIAYDEAKFGGDSDPYAATRRAIVRAAAEIGKAMKEAGK